MLDLDATELDLLWQGLVLLHDATDPKRDAWRWKIIMLKTAIFDEMKKAQA